MSQIAGPYDSAAPHALTPSAKAELRASVYAALLKPGSSFALPVSVCEYATTTPATNNGPTTSPTHSHPPASPAESVSEGQASPSPPTTPLLSPASVPLPATGYCTPAENPMLDDDTFGPRYTFPESGRRDMALARQTPPRSPDSLDRDVRLFQDHLPFDYHIVRPVPIIDLPPASILAPAAEIDNSMAEAEFPPWRAHPIYLVTFGIDPDLLKID